MQITKLWAYLSKNSLFFSFVISLTLIFFTLLIYINILPNQFLFDDEELIYKNAYVANLRLLPKYFTTNMIAGAGKLSNMYRPILILSFAIDHSIWNNNPFGFHLTSIILHAINGILVFFLIYYLFNNKLVSFFTSLFFIIHPVQTEAVSYASGRTDLLAACFTLLSLMFFLSLIKNNKYKFIKYTISIILFILSLLSKETAIILPLLLILIIFAYISKNKSRFILAVIPFILIDFCYIFLRLTVFNFTSFYSNRIFSPEEIIYRKNLFVRLFTFSKVFFDYLGILLFPKDLIIARDTPIILSLFNPWTMTFLFVIILLLIISIKTYKQNRIYFFAFLWFIITISPVSGIIPINNIVAEHYLYFPSLAFFLTVSAFINKILHKSISFEKKLSLILLLIIIIFSLTLRSAVRSFDWRNPIVFYTKSLQQSPWHIPMHNNLAMTYAGLGQFELAVSEYKQILALSDVYPNIHHNLANAYKEIGRYNDAEEEYNKALAQDPKFLFSYYGLIDVYNKTGEKNKLKEIEKKLRTMEGNL